MISLVNIKIYANKKDLIVDTEMIIDRHKLLLNHVPVFQALMETKKYEYDLQDLLETEFMMIINFIDEDNPSFDTSIQNIQGKTRLCKFYETKDCNLVVY